MRSCKCGRSLHSLTGCDRDVSQAMGHGIAARIGAFDVTTTTIKSRFFSFAAVLLCMNNKSVLKNGWCQITPCQVAPKEVASGEEPEMPCGE